MQNFEEKFTKYRLTKTPKPRFKGYRSINPEFPHISKFDDITRYNSANYNVFFYKNYPNRQKTPIQTNRGKIITGYRRSISPQLVKIQSMVYSSCLVNESAKKQLIQKAVKANLKLDNTPPKITIVSPGPAMSTMNDFHKRETNQGYARNGSGGFYTR